MRTRIATIACLAALTGCGGGDAGTDAGNEPGTGQTTAPASATATAAGAPVTLQGSVSDKGTKDLAGATDLTLDLGDFYFAPTYVKGAPGSTVTVAMTNSGKAPHTFTVDAPKVDVTVDVGGTGTATVKLPASGALLFYCKFHQAQGMQGAFYDTPGATVAGGSSGDGAYGQ